MNETQINFLKPEPHFPKEEKPKRPLDKKKLFIYFLLLFLVTFIGGCIIKASTTNWSDDPNTYDPETLKPKKTSILQTVRNFIFEQDKVLKSGSDNRINILLLGMGGAGHDGPYLTDTNIILSVKPQTGEAAMISIPRDLGVKIPNYGWHKINFANSYGEIENSGQGGEMARTIFEDTFDMDIPYYIRVDFTAFKELVDIVEGVQINITNPFIDYEYPGPNYSYQTIIFKEGLQTLDGERALQYSRSRHGNNGQASDFARSHRQQQVITALKEKLMSSGTYTNPIKLKQIFDSLDTHVATNLNFGQIMYLVSMSKNIDMSNVKTLVIDNGVNGYLTTSQSTGSWLLSPKTGNFDEINEAIKNIFNPEFEFKQMETIPQTSTLPNANIEIQNGTWEVGLAGRTQKNLEGVGFSIAEISNSKNRPVATTTIYLVNPNTNSSLVNALAQELKCSIVNSVPPWLLSNYDDPNTASDETGEKFNSSTEILVILGNDKIQSE